MFPQTAGRQPTTATARRAMPVPTWLTNASLRVWARFRLMGRSAPQTAPVFLSGKPCSILLTVSRVNIPSASANISTSPVARPSPRFRAAAFPALAWLSTVIRGSAAASPRISSAVLSVEPSSTSTTSYRS